MSRFSKLAASVQAKLASIRAVCILLAATLWRAIDLRDILWLGGLAAVGYGIAQIYAPAAWVVCGAAIFWKGERS